MKKKILFYQWKSVLHANVEQIKPLIPECAANVIGQYLDDIHTQIDFIEEDEITEEFLDTLFKPKNNGK